MPVSFAPEQTGPNWDRYVANLATQADLERKKTAAKKHAANQLSMQISSGELDYDTSRYGQVKVTDEGYAFNSDDAKKAFYAALNKTSGVSDLSRAGGVQETYETADADQTMDMYRQLSQYADPSPEYQQARSAAQMLTAASVNEVMSDMSQSPYEQGMDEGDHLRGIKEGSRGTAGGQAPSQPAPAGATATKDVAGSTAPDPLPPQADNTATPDPQALLGARQRVRNAKSTTQADRQNWKRTISASITDPNKEVDFKPGSRTTRDTQVGIQDEIKQDLRSLMLRASMLDATADIAAANGVSVGDNYYDKLAAERKAVISRYEAAMSGSGRTQTGTVNDIKTKSGGGKVDTNIGVAFGTSNMTQITMNSSTGEGAAKLEALNRKYMTTDGTGKQVPTPFNANFQLLHQVVYQAAQSNWKDVNAVEAHILKDPQYKTKKNGDMVTFTAADGSSGRVEKINGQWAVNFNPGSTPYAIKHVGGTETKFPGQVHEMTDFDDGIQRASTPQGKVR